MFEKLIIVIPAYNPDSKLPDLVKALLEKQIGNIIVVNDGSNADTASVFEKIPPGAVVIRHPENRGKGRALKTAFQYIEEHYEKDGGWGVLTVDSDGQHKLCDIVKCCEAWKEMQGHKLVLGVRDFYKEKNRKIPFRSRFGNICTQAILQFLCGINVSDTQTGLRLIPYELLSGLVQVRGERYEYETNMLLWCKENGVEFCEVPIETVYEGGNETSHFNPLKDSFLIYKVILMYSVSSLVAVVIDNGLFILLSPYIANVFVLTYAGRAASATVNFTINRKVVFKSRSRNAVRQALRYLGLLLVSGTVSAALVTILSAEAGGFLIGIKLLVEGCLYFFNFYMQKTFVFGKGGGVKNKMGIKCNNFGGRIIWFIRVHYSRQISAVLYKLIAVFHKKKVGDYIKLFDNPEKEIPLFKLVNIETQNRCNGICSFCPANIHDETRDYAKMPEELFEKVAAELGELHFSGRVYLNVNNEPLLDKRMPFFIELLKAKCPSAKICMITNGTLLTAGYLKKLANARLNDLTINHYSTHYELNENIRSIYNYVKNHKEQFQSINITINRRYSEEVLATRAGSAPNKRKKNNRVNEPCLYPFTDIVIFPRGGVGICCNDCLEVTDFGNISTESLVEIWNNKKFQELRMKMKLGREHYPFCTECDVADAGIREKMIRGEK